MEYPDQEWLELIEDVKDVTLGIKGLNISLNELKVRIDDNIQAKERLNITIKNFNEKFTEDCDDDRT